MATLTLLAFIAYTPPTQAADSNWSANLGVVSTYISRGFDQSWGNPALQAGVEYRHDDGWFIGTWGSTVSPYFIEGASLEWDTYLGYGNKYNDLEYEAGLYYYRYPGAQISTTQTRYDYGEAILKAGMHGVTVSYAITFTPDYFGYNSDTLGQGQGLRSRGSGYLALDGSFPLNERLTLSLHYGHQSVRNFSDYNWSDGKIALETNLHGLDIFAGYARAWDTNDSFRRYTTGALDSAGNEHVSDPASGRFFVGVSRAF
jgi:uncharacterized protein (TIGR02001 family)